MRDLSDRVWPEPNSGCHLWSGGVTDRGYGRVLIQGKRRKAHRVIWEEKYGSVPSGMVLDHLCRNRLCVNPEHLESVTSRVNSMRGSSPSIVTHKTGVCQRGHVGKLRGPSGQQRCMECRNAAQQAYYHRNRVRLIQEAIKRKARLKGMTA